MSEYVSLNSPTIIYCYGIRCEKAYYGNTYGVRREQEVAGEHAHSNILQTPGLTGDRMRDG